MPRFRIEKRPESARLEPFPTASAGGYEFSEFGFAAHWRLSGAREIARRLAGRGDATPPTTVSSPSANRQVHALCDPAVHHCPVGASIFPSRFACSPAWQGPSNARSVRPQRCRSLEGEHARARVLRRPGPCPARPVPPIKNLQAPSTPSTTARQRPTDVNERIIVDGHNGSCGAWRSRPSRRARQPRRPRPRIGRRRAWPP